MPDRFIAEMAARVQIPPPNSRKKPREISDLLLNAQKFEKISAGRDGTIFIAR